jgi:hypothetical protein
MYAEKIRDLAIDILKLVNDKDYYKVKRDEAIA